MATIYSNANGQVVQSIDELGDYYYLADGLGEPTDGAWTRQEDAIAALDGEGPAPDHRINGRGERILEPADSFRD